MDIRRWIDLIEARSHAEMNPKIHTEDLLKQYLDDDSMYVHFGKIDKIGINPRSSNMLGPFGVYAMPIKAALGFLANPISLRSSRLITLIKPAPSAKILDLDTVTLPEMKELLDAAMAFHKKKAKGKPELYGQLNTSTVAGMFRGMTQLLSDYCRRRNKKLSIAQNAFFRRQGYDAILDNRQIINDNPSQIVFLIPTAYDVIQTLPIRLKNNP